VQRGRHYWGFEKVSRGANRNQAGENTVMIRFWFDDLTSDGLCWSRFLWIGFGVWM
jgi:hypothetical protein